jgi:phosphotransacetylase
MFPDVDRKAQIINNAVSLMRRAGIENPKVAGALVGRKTSIPSSRIPWRPRSSGR